MKIASPILVALAAALVGATDSDDPSLFCPTYHTIFGHYDPSGPILLNGTWHVFPDGGKPGWAHFTSTDLLDWKEHDSTVANGDTGSVSITDAGVIALYPSLDAQHSGLLRTAPTESVPDAPLSADVAWAAPTFAAKNPGLGVGFRDPMRALQLGDGEWYVGVGTGFGGENNSTALPGKGTGCLAWMKATNASLSEFTFVGCLLNNTHMDGHIDPGTVSWQPQDMPAAFFECPDVFPLGDTGKYVAITSLYNWPGGGYYVNSYFVGTIDEENMSFKVERRGPLDYGQYYAARTGTGADNSEGTARRVLFSATGWHSPPGWPNPPQCKTQMHLIPRDLKLDAQSRLTFHPISELSSLHRTEEPSLVNSRGGDNDDTSVVAAQTLPRGSALELRLNCTGAPKTTTSSSRRSSGSSSQGVVGFDLLSNENRTSFVRVAFDYEKSELQVDHTHGGGADSKIVQTAPLVLDKGEDVELVVLLDHSLLEVFLNRRAVLSSFATHVFAHPLPGPEQRSNFVVSPPEGVSCTAQAWAMKRLTPTTSSKE